ncbi:recombinase family protein [Microbacterium excoecariae]|uniref:recombinase family protein n=1 Tax=Microbacterium excoecariae TaxID=2715210 RepID=UPI00140A954C|nr:recombinase family protein [Microbacterium excoecariae]NHI16785.1 recombinase family protein [Microbacterium excoecariae]
MTLIGLVRVTRDPLHVQEQHDAVGPMCARVFEEESSRRRLVGSRPTLLAVVEQLGTDDRLVVRKVRDLARSMVDGWELLIELLEHGIAVRVLEGSDAGDYNELSDIREAAREITDMRRSTLRDRIKDGLQAARERGAPGGRPRVVDYTMRAAIFKQRDRGETLRAIAQLLGDSIGTVHNVLRAEKPTDASS